MPFAAVLANSPTPEGFNDRPAYLSPGPGAGAVGLDHAAAPRWEVVDVKPGVVALRTTTTKAYLSVSADGKVVDLYGADDGSGRQHWVVLEDGTLRVETGMAPGAPAYLCRAGNLKVKLVAAPEAKASPQAKWTLVAAIVAAAQGPKKQPPRPQPTTPPTAPPTQGLEDCFKQMESNGPIRNVPYASWRDAYVVMRGADGREYLVYKGEAHPDEVVKALVDLNRRTEAAVAKFISLYPNDPRTPNLRPFAPDGCPNVHQMTPNDGGRAYAQGAWIHTMVPVGSWDNTPNWEMYYALHELAHIMGAWSHNPTFYQNYHDIAQAAAAAGVYDNSSCCAPPFPDTPSGYGAWNPFTPEGLAQCQKLAAKYRDDPLIGR